MQDIHHVTVLISSFNRRLCL